MSVYLSVCLSIYLSLSLSLFLHLSFHLSIYLSVYPSIYLYVYYCIYIYIHTHTHQPQSNYQSPKGAGHPEYLKEPYRSYEDSFAKAYRHPRKSMSTSTAPRMMSCTISSGSLCCNILRRITLWKENPPSVGAPDTSSRVRLRATISYPPPPKP